MDGTEECDPGTHASGADAGPACTQACTFVGTCGDAIVQIGEACDDGKNNGSAQCGGCSAQCQLDPYCGDGVTDKQCGETCDDGVNIGGYGYCMPNCTMDAYCGDGIVQTQYGETCDLGSQNGVVGSGCTITCGMPAVCGDAVVQPPETCDDGINDGSYGVAGCVDPREVGDRRGSQPGFDTGGSGKESHFFGPWPRLRLA